MLTGKRCYTVHLSEFYNLYHNINLSLLGNIMENNLETYQSRMENSPNPLMVLSSVVYLTASTNELDSILFLEF